MPDYKNGKIYKLFSYDNDLIYIGSTTQELYKRLCEHKSRANICNSKLLFEASNNVKIELIEEYACNNKMELTKKEGEHIRANDCVNKVIAGRSNKEWHDDNKDKQKEYHKEYRNKNKDKIKEYLKNNKDKINERLKKYREDNRDKIKEYNNKWLEDNRDKLKEYRREKYRLKKLQNIEKN